jgi:hypothetical protein
MRAVLVIAFMVLALARTASAQVVGAASPLAAVRASETAVRAMPMEERPNRLGHFYGNSIRRAQQGRLCVNCGQTDRPLARYLYMSR